MSREDIRISNRDLRDCAAVMDVVLGRKNRDVPTVFRLARIGKTISPIAEDIDHSRRKISIQFAQKDENEEVIYEKNDKGMETGNFAVDPRKTEEFRAAVLRLERETNVIVGISKLKAKAMIDGWKTRKKKGDDDEEYFEGVEPAVIMGLAPFLDLDGLDVDSPVAVTVQRESSDDENDAPDVGSLAPDNEGEETPSN